MVVFNGMNGAWINVGEKNINHPWLGMGIIPPIKMVMIWGMVYDCFFTHIIMIIEP